MKDLDRKSSGVRDWDRELFARLRDTDEPTAAAADLMLESIRTNRRSKKPRRL